MHEVNLKKVPDRLFHNFRLLESVDRRALCCLEMSIDGFCGSKIVKVSVRLALFTEKTRSVGKIEQIDMNST